MRPAVEACAAGRSDNITAEVRIAGATATITSVIVQTALGEAVRSCVKDLMDGLGFPRFSQATLTVTYTYVVPPAAGQTAASGPMEPPATARPSGAEEEGARLRALVAAALPTFWRDGVLAASAAPDDEYCLPGGDAELILARPNGVSLVYVPLSCNDDTYCLTHDCLEAEGDIGSPCYCVDTSTCPCDGEYVVAGVTRRGDDALQYVALPECLPIMAASGPDGWQWIDLDGAGAPGEVLAAGEDRKILECEDLEFGTACGPPSGLAVVARWDGCAPLLSIETLEVGPAICDGWERWPGREAGEFWCSPDEAAAVVRANHVPVVTRRVEVDAGSPPSVIVSECRYDFTGTLAEFRGVDGCDWSGADVSRNVYRWDGQALVRVAEQVAPVGSGTASSGCLGAEFTAATGGAPYFACPGLEQMHPLADFDPARCALTGQLAVGSECPWDEGGYVLDLNAASLQLGVVPPAEGPGEVPGALALHEVSYDGVRFLVDGQPCRGVGQDEYDEWLFNWDMSNTCVDTSAPDDY
ncbi:MAG: hypothetical protein HY905_12445 [Deltaproteobacteria bacterium]|nr:hypothetical protein [Deltaproteobacteria bacterium]